MNPDAESAPQNGQGDALPDFLAARGRPPRLPEGPASLPPAPGAGTLELGDSGSTKPWRLFFFQTFLFQKKHTQKKTGQNLLCQELFLKRFNPGAISKGIYPDGSHSLTLNSPRCCLV